MKLIACLLSLLIPLSAPVAPCREITPAHSDGTALRWYVKRNRDHKTPELPPEFSCLNEYDGFYVDLVPDAKIVYMTFDAGPLHRRHFIEQIGGFDEKMPRGQEYDLHFRLANAGCEFVYCPVYTFSYRSHDSIFRISTGTKKKTYESTSYMMRMNDKFESLLMERHEALPYKFEDAFFRFWFGRARDAYARRKKEDGDYCMKHADRYERAKTTFYKTYQLLGKILGYVWLEKCFRLRIKMLGKDKKEEAPSGIARYI